MHSLAGPPATWQHRLTVVHVLRARALLKKEKEAGGKSILVSEFLQALPATVVYMFAEMFIRRFESSAGEDEVESWKVAMMSFLKKVPSVCMLGEEFRGISLLDVPLKWYLSSVAQSMQEVNLAPKWASPVVFGRGKGRGADQLQALFQVLFAKAHE